MLLQALHKYADERGLLDNLAFQQRKVHLLLPLNADGSLRTEWLPLLTTPGERNPERADIGLEDWLPRFPGENNGGKAYYLADHLGDVCGVSQENGDPLPAEPTGRADRNPVLKFKHFWTRIAEAFQRTADERLGALIGFRERYLSGKAGFGRGLPFLQVRQLPKARAAELCVRTDGDTWTALKKANAVAFEIDGERLTVAVDADQQLLWAGDKVWDDWAVTYRREAFADGGDETSGAAVTKARSTICLVSGAVGQPVAQSHKPTITKVPGLTSGGYVVSFAKEAPAFSSFGFEMGANAPVSETAAAKYALALNELLASDDHSFAVGGVKFCYWAEGSHAAGDDIGCLLDQAIPSSVGKFLKAPFSGIERGLTDADKFLSVSLSGNAGRVVVREWLQVPLSQAIPNLELWFQQLEIVALGAARGDDDDRRGPYALVRLAAAMVRENSELERVSEAIALLYRAALTKVPVPLRFLGPLLAEFRSALVTDSAKKPKYPFNQSRFALLKLILTRNPNGGFTPMPQLADTDDQAYNLGRLLQIFSSLQDAAHEYELEGAGVVERYYGTASSAPAGVFAVLWKLHNHHLRKLEQQGDKGQGKASAIRTRIAEIVGKFSPAGPNQPPRFPRQLSLEAQGRFALGFYQQMAADKQAIRDNVAAKKADAK